MNKIDLIKVIHEEVGISTEDANKVITTIFNKIIDAWDNGEEINIPRFGVLYISPAGTPTFSAGKSLRGRYKNKDGTSTVRNKVEE